MMEKAQIIQVDEKNVVTLQALTRLTIKMDAWYVITPAAYGKQPRGPFANNLIASSYCDAMSVIEQNRRG